MRFNLNLSKSSSHFGRLHPWLTRRWRPGQYEWLVVYASEAANFGKNDVDVKAMGILTTFYYGFHTGAIQASNRFY